MLKKISTRAILFVTCFVMSSAFADQLFNTEPQKSGDSKKSTSAMSPEEFKNLVKTKSQQVLKDSTKQALDITQQQISQLPAKSFTEPTAPPQPTANQTDQDKDKDKTETPNSKTNNSNNPASIDSAPEDATDNSSNTDNSDNQNTDNAQNNNQPADNNQTTPTTNNSGSFNLKY